MNDKKEIVEYRGVRNLVAAEVLTDTAEEITFGTPFVIAGVAELTKSTESSSEAHYYDNVPAVVIDSTGSDEVGVNVSAIPLDVLAKITGQYYDDATGMFVEGERKSTYFALGYITENTKSEEMFVWRMKGKFNIPDSTHNTKDDGTDATGQELTYTGISTTHKFALGDKTETIRAVTVNASKGKQDESTFFAAVQTPATISASTNTPSE